jgi:hypothetical protein
MFHAEGVVTPYGSAVKKKREYIPPIVEHYLYQPEKGYAFSIANERATHERDYVLIEGNDRSSYLASEEITEYTDNGGQYSTGEWD